MCCVWMCLTWNKSGDLETSETKARDHFLIVKIWRNTFNKYLKYVVINNKLLKISVKELAVSQ